MALITEQEDTIKAAIARAALSSPFLNAADRIEVHQGKVARHERKDGQVEYATEAELVLRIPFGTSFGRVAAMINQRESEDLKTRFPGQPENAVVLHRGEWAASPYMNREEQYWVLTRVVGYTTA